MSTTIVAARAPSVVFPIEPAVLPVRSRVGPGRFRAWWDRVSFWPAEFLRLVALIYMLPVVIYAIGIPVAAALSAVLFGAGWFWKVLWP